MLYDYLLTMFKVIVGLITTERMIYFALGSVAIYILWMFVSLATCFQKRFYRNSVKLYDYAKKGQLNPKEPEVLDKRISKISKGFFYSWRKFKAAEYGKPSEFITRREVLDVEINGGVLNQGKSFMKAFINFVTIVLFMFNLAYLSGRQGISLYLLAESLVFPLVLFAVLRVFYYLYTSIKQQFYKQDVEIFYDVILVLDEIYSKSERPVYFAGSNQTNVDVLADESSQMEAPQTSIEEVLNEEMPAESVEEVQVEEEVEDEQIKRIKKKSIDDYDIFKKKNIDVDKILNEVPQSSTTLPYIDVDSDYVIKDDDAPLAKAYTETHNGSEVLGGMMQDMSSIKKQKDNQNFIDVDKEIATIDPELQEAHKAEDEEKKEETPAESVEETPAEEKKESDDVFENLSNFEVEGSSEIIESVQEEKTEELPEIKEEAAETPLEEPQEEVVKLVPPEEEKKKVEIHYNDEVSDETKENIANIVGGFKTNRSKLASGGVVIERHEPHVKKEYPKYEEPEETYAPAPSVTKLETNEDENSVLNSLKGGASLYDTPSYDAGYDPYAVQQTPYAQGYMQQPQATPYNQTYGYNAGYVQPMSNPYMQQQPPQYEQPNAYNQNFNSYDEPEEVYEEDYEEEYVEEYEEEDVVETPKVKKTTAKPAAKKTTKAKEKPVVEEVKTPAKTRGRPKKQVFDETITIKSDKEFNQVLSRAEKLMRKSDEGLSASQSKRIEKELKMLMDAMNRYKEGK